MDKRQVVFPEDRNQLRKDGAILKMQHQWEEREKEEEQRKKQHDDHIRTERANMLSVQKMQMEQHRLQKDAQKAEKDNF